MFTNRKFPTSVTSKRCRPAEHRGLVRPSRAPGPDREPERPVARRLVHAIVAAVLAHEAPARDVPAQVFVLVPRANGFPTGERRTTLEQHVLEHPIRCLLANQHEVRLGIGGIGAVGMVLTNSGSPVPLNTPPPVMYCAT